MKSLRADLKAFIELGEILKSLTDTTLSTWYPMISNNNAWFTPASVKFALDGIIELLDENSLEAWEKKYSIPVSSPKKVGIIAAGNIPGVAFHDILCVILSGHEAYVKLSSSDKIFLPLIFQLIKEEYPEVVQKIHWAEQLKNMDAYIATGSDNSARYFEYYFKNTPHLIRKNRTSLAVFTGNESAEELYTLGKDVFTYFGLGCRNVSKVFFPKGFQIPTLLDQWNDYLTIAEHHKYFNNYEYNKAVFLINKVPHWDNGAVIIKEDAALFSPIGVVHVEFYDHKERVNEFIQDNIASIQCVVSNADWIQGANTVQLGEAQCPSLDDFADGVDTMKFLIEL
ncbi:MAG: acyl-CoA reductase [Cytophagaceae bacterium]